MPRSAFAGRESLLACSSVSCTRAAHSNAAVDAAAAATLELATLQRDGLTSALPLTGVLVR